MCTPTPQVSDTEREGSWSPGRGDRALATRSHKAPSRHDRPRLSPQPSRPQPQRPQEVPGVVPPVPGSSKWGNGHVVASHYSGAQKPQDTRGEALKHRLEGGCPPQGPRASVPTAPSVIRATLHPALLPALKDPPHASELPGGKPAPHLPAPASRAGRSSGKSTAGNRKRGSHRLPGAVSAHTGLGRREREDEGDGSPQQALAQGTPSL